MQFELNAFTTTLAAVALQAVVWMDSCPFTLKHAFLVVDTGYTMGAPPQLADAYSSMALAGAGGSLLLSHVADKICTAALVEAPSAKTHAGVAVEDANKPTLVHVYCCTPAPGEHVYDPCQMFRVTCPLEQEVALKDKRTGGCTMGLRTVPVQLPSFGVTNA